MWRWTKDEIGVAVQSGVWVRVELMVVSLKCHSGQLSIAISKNHSVMNTIYIYIHIYIYICILLYIVYIIYTK